jgi:hypothetical protein
MVMQKVVFLLMITLFTACDNPFKNDEISGSQRTLTGTVKTDPQSDPVKVYVWLEGFRVGTLTKSDGTFSLTLPPGSATGSPDGVYNLYFYCGNFKLNTIPIAVQNGEFLYNDYGIDGKGRLVDTIVMISTLNITNRVTPQELDTMQVKKFSIRMDAFSSMPSLRSVFLPNATDSYLGAIYYKDTKTGVVTVHKRLSGPGGNLKVQIPQSGKAWILIMGSQDLPAQSGPFEIYSHITPDTTGVPKALLQDLGIDPFMIASSYLDFPIIQEPALLKMVTQNTSPQ